MPIIHQSCIKRPRSKYGVSDSVTCQYLPGGGAFLTGLLPPFPPRNSNSEDSLDSFLTWCATDVEEEGGGGTAEFATPAAMDDGSGAGGGGGPDAGAETVVGSGCGGGIDDDIVRGRVLRRKLLTLGLRAVLTSFLFVTGWQCYVAGNIICALAGRVTSTRVEKERRERSDVPTPSFR